MTINYEWKFYVYEGEQTDDPQECAACHAHVPVYTFMQRDKSKKSTLDRSHPVELCEICSSSSVGTAYEYPLQYPNKDQLEVTAFCTNEILKQLGRFGPAPSFEDWQASQSGEGDDSSS